MRARQRHCATRARVRSRLRTKRQPRHNFETTQHVHLIIGARVHTHRRVPRAVATCMLLLLTVPRAGQARGARSRAAARPRPPPPTAATTHNHAWSTAAATH
jgi:hypothetical protein